MRKPAFGVAVISPLILAGAVGASAPSTVAPIRDSAVTPLAAVESSSGSRSGVSVVAVTKTPTPFHIAAGSVSAPPPSMVVNSPGSLRIPAMALSAYRNAERIMAAASPACGVSWNLLAGIGRIESMHANGGATDASGTAVRPIYGPVLDGTLPGNEIIVQSRSSDRLNYARAMGPMQFLPGTWSRYASDGDGDGKADVQNLYDSTLAAARYLCSGGLNLRDPNQVMAAILRYNNSVAYARNVLGWAAAYATGVVPVDLPPITGPVPPLGDAHLDQYEGLGPGLPLNALGLPATDPLALMPVMLNGDVASQLYAGQSLGPLPGPAPAYVPSTPQTEQPTAPPWLPPWMQQQQAQQPQRSPQCAVFCITTPPSAPAPESLPAAPGDAQMLMPQAPPAAPAPAEEPAAVLPLAPGPAPGPAA
ncbi:membrane-bound lytic murein transglycosylase B [Mycolicibacterium moriokaense]|uniref:Membrane-bound lytic murein transglycosylase B n=2 Tax=Mycolicibacterium moriokaense TaxID=39691 RepID=A0A318HT32_9MYCO|nr:lytic murein transglycosylase [Mycolicibacterium moriokaense]PXX08151.1 membrane-bound lytic murein transglycosylase B [Mycolicibacterium moriokaense]